MTFSTARRRPRDDADEQRTSVAREPVFTSRSTRSRHTFATTASGETVSSSSSSSSSIVARASRRSHSSSRRPRPPDSSTRGGGCWSFALRCLHASTKNRTASPRTRIARDRSIESASTHPYPLASALPAPVSLIRPPRREPLPLNFERVTLPPHARESSSPPRSPLAPPERAPPDASPTIPSPRRPSRRRRPPREVFSPSARREIVVARARGTLARALARRPDSCVTIGRSDSGRRVNSLASSFAARSARENVSAPLVDAASRGSPPAAAAPPPRAPRSVSRREIRRVASNGALLQRYRRSTTSQRARAVAIARGDVGVGV